jgi:hypothetical protein
MIYQKFITLLLAFTILITFTGCDPVHDVKLENQTRKPIEVFYSPRSDVSYSGNNKSEILKVNGRDLNKIVLDSAETIVIGKVFARYIPQAKDIDIDYLEIQYGSDTIKLIGKHAIFSTIKKVKKLDWRLIIK